MARSPKSTDKLNKLERSPAQPRPVSATKSYDFDKLLTAEEQEDIRQRAKARVEALEREEAEEALLKQFMDEEERARHPEIVQEMKEIRLDLALYADSIRLDGRQYFHGEVYTVPKSVYDVFKEIEQATHRHEQEIHDGDSGDAYYRKSRQMRLSMRTGEATANGAPVRF